MTRLQSLCRARDCHKLGILGECLKAGGCMIQGKMSAGLWLARRVNARGERLREGTRLPKELVILSLGIPKILQNDST
jgi:hypothetical protein